MRANNLTISIPTPPCKQGCQFCVSNMTFGVEEDKLKFKFNLPKVRDLAQRVGVTHVLITGKGDPIDNYEGVLEVFEVFEQYWPIEIQIHIDRMEDILYDEHFYDFDIISMSVDHPDQLDKYAKYCNEWHSLSRMAVVLNKNFDGMKLGWFLERCRELNFDQLTIRQPTIPFRTADTKISKITQDWIKENAWPILYQDNILKEFQVMVERGGAVKIRDLMFGASVYDIGGIGFTHMEYCVESQNGEVMRSLIYQADGHLYTTWDHKGSIIF